METLNFEIMINAPIQKVWDLLWNQDSYTQWTQFFGEGSHYKSDWKVNGKTYFLGATGDGMVSTIKSLNEPEEVVFSHLGMIKDGVEDTKSKEVAEWSGSEESYFLRAISEDSTELRVILHTSKDYSDHMKSGFDQGLQLLKELAEQ